jgi:DNA-binding NtrC family response regulator
LNQILIIDDEDKLRALLAKIIRLEGFDVIESADCKTALKKLEQHEIDVVLCDVKLPDGNGVELSKKIKETIHKLKLFYLQPTAISLMEFKRLKMGLLTTSLKVMTTTKLCLCFIVLLKKYTLQRGFIN